MREETTRRLCEPDHHFALGQPPRFQKSWYIIFEDELFIQVIETSQSILWCLQGVVFIFCSKTPNFTCRQLDVYDFEGRIFWVYSLAN